MQINYKKGDKKLWVNVYRMVELNLSELTMKQQTIDTIGIHTFFLINFSYQLLFVLYATELRFT